MANKPLPVEQILTLLKDYPQTIEQVTAVLT